MMTLDQLKKSRAAAISIGALAIASGLTALITNKPVDCSLPAVCERLDESMGAWVKCPNQTCVDDVERGYRELRAACPQLSPSALECAPILKRTP